MLGRIEPILKVKHSIATVNSTLPYGDGAQPMAEAGTPGGGGAEVEPWRTPAPGS